MASSTLALAIVGEFEYICDIFFFIYSHFNVKFYAIVPIGHQHRRVSLTHNLSCIWSASDGSDRKSLYRAFTAASFIEARILQAPETNHTYSRYPDQ